LNIKYRVVLLALIVATFLGNNSFALDDYEKMKCKKKLASLDAGLSSLPLNDVLVEVGKTFMGTPYVAGTLDEDTGKENVVVHITGLDCVTFVENCLVMARLLKENKTDFDSYLKELELVRYRGGVNTGYASRLHYFSDWIYDNEAKGIVKDISKEIGGVTYDKFIDFMSTHRSSYKQLASNENLEGIQEVENSINQRESYYIPEDMISSVYDKLENGDIIGITSALDGLDIAHTGLVYKDGTGTYLLHASLKNKEVEISRSEIMEYIQANTKQDGIMVARVVDVK
jgi:hypothetical protein